MFDSLKSAKSSKSPKRKRALVLSGGGARGAYQAGVIKYLYERDWKPDLVVGTSAGAINAMGIGCNMSSAEIADVWTKIERKRVFHVSLLHQILYFLGIGNFASLGDTTPLRNLLLDAVDFSILRKNPTEIVLSAVGVLDARLRFFNNKVIDIEHILASSAIPIIFPWQYIDGVPHWDGGVVANTPLLPALEREATEIIVVLLSPVGGNLRMGLPRNKRQAVELVFEQAQLGSYQAIMSHLAFRHKKENAGLIDNLFQKSMNIGGAQITTVAPGKMLGFYSMLNFSSRAVDKLLRMGYKDATTQLKDYPF